MSARARMSARFGCDSLRASSAFSCRPPTQPSIFAISEGRGPPSKGDHHAAVQLRDPGPFKTEPEFSMFEPWEDGPLAPSHSRAFGEP